MPTLPALMTRVAPMARSKGMWVCPQTTLGAEHSAKAGATASAGVLATKISLSSRGVAWQNRTPSRLIASGQLRIQSSISASNWRAAQRRLASAASGIRSWISPSSDSNMPRSQLPRTQCRERPSPRKQAKASAGMGPSATSPPSTTASTPAARASAITASSAGKLPWISNSAATRIGSSLGCARGFAAGGRGGARLRRRQPRGEHAVGRAGDVVEAGAVEEANRGRIAAVLAADADLEIGSSLAAVGGGQLHQLSDAGLVEAGERILLEHALAQIHRQDLADVIAGEAEGGLGQIVGSEAEELGLGGDLAGHQRRPRQLDHGAHQVGDLDLRVGQHLVGHAAHDGGLHGQLL